MIKFPAFLLIFFIILMFVSSCAAQVTGSLKGDGQADLYVYAALEPRMTALIGGLAAASGAAKPGAPILDGPAISASMAAAPGVSSVVFKNIAPAAIEGPVTISRINDFLAPAKGLAGSNKVNFISFEQAAPPLTGGSSSGGRCRINMSLDSGPEILTLISPEISAYLMALLAPLATGEAMTKTEYLTLVRSIYGRAIADEIAQAKIRAFIDFPGPVQSAKGGTFSGRRAEFTIPLLDILTLETPLSYEVVW